MHDRLRSDESKPNLAELEDEVKDAVITGQSEDLYLLRMIELVLATITTGRELYANPFDEPTFYRRHFLPWVKEGMEERARIKAEQEKLTNTTE
jgi:hypothetical protein